jgi:dienelactone hydrolase
VRTRRRSAFLALALLVVTVLAAACDPPPPDPPPPASPMPVGVTHPVATNLFAFTDYSRGVAGYGDWPGLWWRDIPAQVWWPTDSKGPFPMVVFSHGYGVTPDWYAPLLERIASAGYVVAAPVYPLLSGWPAGPSDTVGWDDLAPDTQFITSQMLDLSASGHYIFGGMIDPNRIAAVGHSDGAVVAFNDVFTPGKLDPRVRAAVVLNADLQYYGGYQPNGRPILDVFSDQDAYNPYFDAVTWARGALEEPRTFLTLWNASHEGPAMDPADPHFDVLSYVTIAFLDAHLKGHPERLADAETYVANHWWLAATG